MPTSVSFQLKKKEKTYMQHVVLYHLDTIHILLTLRSFSFILIFVLLRTCVPFLSISRTIAGTLIGVRTGERALPNQHHRHSISQLMLRLSIYSSIMKVHVVKDSQ